MHQYSKCPETLIFDAWGTFDLSNTSALGVENKLNLDDRENRAEQGSVGILRTFANFGGQLIESVVKEGLAKWIIQKP